MRNRPPKAKAEAATTIEPPPVVRGTPPRAGRRIVKAAATFALLLAGYTGYVRTFAIIAARVSVARPDANKSLGRVDSRTKRQAIELARKTFGNDHWSTDPDLSFRFYNVERGYYMFARSYEVEDGGKVLVFAPFAVIWRSRDGKKLQTATSDRARITLDQPMSVSLKPGSAPLRVVHARIEGDVRIRDDKGTPIIPADDLRIGPLTYVEYDEPTLTIKSESDVIIEDRDLRATAIGLLIVLRPKDPNAPGGGAGGFDGAQTFFLKSNVHIVARNGGKSGLLPGSGRPAQGKDKKKEKAEPNPVDIRCDGELRIDLPEHRAPVLVGPPAPPAPTYAKFTRNVRVLSGKSGEKPDQLLCDDLLLTLLPADRAAHAPKTEVADEEGDEPSEDEAGGGPLADLELKRANATGHAVWLESAAQESRAFCNELIYDKYLPVAPDKIYLRADANKQIAVLKIDRVQEGPDFGKIQTVTDIRTTDATIFDNGQNNGGSNIVARGPGTMETRPAIDKPVERTAVWNDELIVLNLTGPDKLPRKQITLKGQPRFIDPAQATLDAKKTIVVLLRPKPAPPRKTGDTTPVPTTEAFEIERLVAEEDVHLTATSERLSAREWLVAQFEPSPAPAAPAAVSPAPEPPAPAPVADGQAAPAAKPAKPQADAKADRVRAWIVQRPGTGKAPAGPLIAGQGGGNADVKKVELRGAVVFHQDPEPGKEAGTDAAGEAVNLWNVGANLWNAEILDREPETPPSAELAARLVPPAEVSTEGHRISGPRIVLNQENDQAWVEGPGTLTLMTERGLLTDKAQTAEPGPRPDPDHRDAARPKVETRKVPLTISWKLGMRFFGRTKDPQGRDTALAEFFGRDKDDQGRPLSDGPTDIVRAEMEDGLIVCREMRVYMDRPVAFARPKPAPAQLDADATPEPEPRPEIASIECYTNVTAISRKVDPKARTLIQQERIEADDLLTYEKATGNFHVRGPGIVYLINREGEGANATSPGGMAGPRPAIRPAAGPGRGAPGQRAGQGQAQGQGKRPAPFQLTQIRFRKQMKGRFGEGKQTDTTEPRWADFFGDIESIHGPVPDLKGRPGMPDVSYRHNPDRLRPDDSFMTAQTLRVISEPPPPGAPEGTPAHDYMQAWERVYVLHGTGTIEADRATYDSVKNLYHAYGDGGRKVLVVQQHGPGQPATQTSGNAVRYNHKTGEAEVMDPQALQLFDKIGHRPTPPAEPGPTPPKRFRTLRQTPRTNIERRMFNGR